MERTELDQSPVISDPHWYISVNQKHFDFHSLIVKMIHLFCYNLKRKFPGMKQFIIIKMFLLWTGASIPMKGILSGGQEGKLICFYKTKQILVRVFVTNCYFIFIVIWHSRVELFSVSFPPLLYCCPVLWNGFFKVYICR